MTILQTFKHRSAAAVLILASALAAGLSSCDRSFVYDYEGDCDPHYRVRFRYDWNMEFSDAFPKKVDHVNLSIVDEDGSIVYNHVESGEALAADGYEVVLDQKLKPGNYRLHAWCGAGAAPGSSSFAVHPAENVEDLKCTLLPDDATAKADIDGADGTHVQRPLQDLYHGYTEAFEFPQNEGTHTFTVPLKKNTNDVVVVLQQMSAEPLDAKALDVTITSANARMAHDNSIIDAEPVVYHPWSVRQGSAEMDGTTNGVFSAAINEFTVARLMKDENVRLEVSRDGNLLFGFNLIELALMVKSAKLDDMEPQEYLDRTDNYKFVFFLDSQYRWTSVEINILSWKLVIQNTSI